MDEMFAGSDSDLRRVDALVGADGIHSTVRGIIFGPENRPSHAK
jgi:2-polyprenyl-6-methoxyphenol hydroxylase-like FAD-dependent oxidoreductase